MAWLSRNDYVPTDRVRSDMFNSLANDDRNWGGDVNGGGYVLSNVILAGSGGFEFRVSPLEITPGSDGQTVVQFDQTVSVNQLARWTVGKDQGAETGGNAGSNFHIKRYNDAGAYLSSPISIFRDSGLVLLEAQQWNGPVNANGQTISNLVISGVMIDPLTTKGDLVVRSATAPARLGVGTDGQILTADSTQTLGIRWVMNNAVPNTRQVLAGAGMTGGGALTADVTLNANVTSVFGRTGAVVLTPADLTGQGAVLNTRAVLAGAGMTGGGTLTADVTLNANVTSVFGRTGAVVLTSGDISGAGGVPATRQIITSTGLAGGGDLTADRTLVVVEDSTTQRIRFANAGVLVGTRREVNLIAGPNISFTTFADNTANNRIDLTIASTTAMITVYTNSAVLGQATAIDFSAGPNVVIGGSMDGTRANLVITSAGGGAGGMIDPTQAVGDLIVRSPTTTVRFPASLTDGWVLTADAAEPLKMKWAVPKGGIEDPTTLPGDILVRNDTQVTNLPVGSTSGWVLTVDQNAAEKIKWAPVPAQPQTPWAQDIDGAGFRLLNTGNVGIGKSAPKYQCDIYGAGQSSNLYDTVTGQRGGAFFVQDSGGVVNNGGVVAFGAQQGDFAAIKAMIQDGTGYSLGDLAFFVRQAVNETFLRQAMHITYTGRVGIGTDIPASRLEADLDGPSGGVVICARQQTGSWGTTAAFNSYRFFLADSNATDGNFKTFHVGPGGVAIGYGTTPVYASPDALYINGNVGIATATPNYRLHMETGRALFSPSGELYAVGVRFNSASPIMWLGADASGIFTISDVSGTPRLRIDQSGRVGIPVIESTANLAVAGQTSVSSNIAGTGYAQAALEVRETNRNDGTSTGDNNYAPRIAFHWAGVVASQIGMGSDGTIRTFDNPGTGYASFACASLTVNGAFNLHQTPDAGANSGAYRILSSDGAGNVRLPSVWLSNLSVSGVINGLTFQGDGVAPGANQILRTGGQGYVWAGWINTVSGDAGAAPINRVYASDDQFIRYYSLANFSAQIKPRVLSGEAPDAEIAEGQVSVFPVSANRMHFKWRWGGAIITKYIDFQ